jgi:exonuclease SbcC
MRPVTLEIEGFTAFREAETLDFTDADLFALTGPTGAGKTSIIDAMCFALYGSVPRLDRRQVAPVVSVGKREARIRFGFTVDGRAYTAVRVVRRTPAGATTAEARLEQDTEVLAGDADGVTKRVEELLGLTFEQFTTCVVLPQGEFARFLRDTPTKRQELLVRLLGLDVYRRMAQRANQRAAGAGAVAQAAADQLAQLDGATEAAVAAAEERAVRLRVLRDRLLDAQPRLDALLADGRRIVEDGAAAAERAKLLDAVTVPAGVEALAGRARDAAEAADAADAGCERCEREVAEAEEALAGLPDRASLQLAVAAHAERQRLEADLPALVAEAHRAGQAADKARAAFAAASARLDGLRREHAAHDLARHLTRGDPCPVCEQPVPELPDRTAPSALADAERELATAAGAAERHARAQARADSAVDAQRQRLADLERTTGTHPDPDALDAALTAVAEAEARLAAARTADRNAREGARTAQQAARAAQRELASAWGAFDAARDAVAALDPPAADRSDLAAAWAALAAWAAERLPGERATADAAHAKAAELREEYRRVNGELIAACEAHGVVAGAAGLSTATMQAVAQAEAGIERLRDEVRRADALRAQVAEQTAAQQVAHALGQHLKANRFEQWLLDEALQRLVEGASGVLRELSSGQYSLALDPSHQFLVVDHRNADERRQARTLSGGETFLASLALALTLAEHLAELAAGGGGRLESIFLDEGFGTLDNETLDVVTAAIEELGARGRTVGLVTHVRELAERVPVRFEVRREPATSTVARVER